MIKIENQEKHRKCTSCLGDIKLMKIILSSNEQQNISHYMCSKCFCELQRLAIKFQANNKFGG